MHRKDTFTIFITVSFNAKHNLSRWAANVWWRVCSLVGLSQFIFTLFYHSLPSWRSKIYAISFFVLNSQNFKTFLVNFLFARTLDNKTVERFFSHVARSISTNQNSFQYPIKVSTFPSCLTSHVIPYTVLASNHWNCFSAFVTKNCTTFGI